MTYKIWDKKTSIYDVTAEQAIINNPLYGSEDSYLFLNDDGSIYDILPISTIRTLTGETDADTACKAYIEMLTTIQSPDGDTPSEDVSALKKEVEDLKAELEAAKILLGVE